MAAVDTSPTAAELTSRYVYAAYFGAQAVVGVAFWLLVAEVAPVRKLFEMDPHQHAVTNSYLFADIFIGIIGSALAAVAVRRSSRSDVPLAMFTAGGMVYATLYLVGWVAFTSKGGALLALMIPPSTLSAWVSYQVWRASARRPG